MVLQPIPRNPLKRHHEEEYHKNRCKVANQNKSKVCDFNCSAYYKGEILDFQLSQVFTQFRFAVLFFCSYDFTSQSREDLLHIQESYSKLIEFGALPIVITQDRAQVHSAYATPGRTGLSLSFEPSYLMASDGTDRLIARAYKALDPATLEIQRSVIIINTDFHVLFTHKVPDQKYFPMTSILNCFEQSIIP